MEQKRNGSVDLAKKEAPQTSPDFVQGEGRSYVDRAIWERSVDEVEATLDALPPLGRQHDQGQYDTLLDTVNNREHVALGELFDADNLLVELNAAREAALTLAQPAHGPDLPAPATEAVLAINERNDDGDLLVARSPVQSASPEPTVDSLPDATSPWGQPDSHPFGNEARVVFDEVPPQDSHQKLAEALVDGEVPRAFGKHHKPEEKPGPEWYNQAFGTDLPQAAPESPVPEAYVGRHRTGAGEAKTSFQAPLDSDNLQLKWMPDPTEGGVERPGSKGWEEKFQPLPEQEHPDTKVDVEETGSVEKDTKPTRRRLLRRKARALPPAPRRVDQMDEVTAVHADGRIEYVHDYVDTMREIVSVVESKFTNDPSKEEAVYRATSRKRLVAGLKRYVLTAENREALPDNWTEIIDRTFAKGTTTLSSVSGGRLAIRMERRTFAQRVKSGLFPDQEAGTLVKKEPSRKRSFRDRVDNMMNYPVGARIKNYREKKNYYLIHKPESNPYESERFSKGLQRILANGEMI